MHPLLCIYSNYFFGLIIDEHRIASAFIQVLYLF